VAGNTNWNAFFLRFAQLPPGKKIAAMVVVAAMLAGVVALTLWARQPEYRILYTNLSDRDGGMIIAALSQMKIPYRFNEGGSAITVPANRVHEARLQLASKGLPKGSIVGFELLENQKFGVTQFQEQVSYQRALEGELVRSIEALSAVESARVHLAIPRSSVFLRENEKPSASVLLNLRSGQTLERSQVSGIMHLVASSVANLPVSGVSVLDQNGALLSNAQGSVTAQLDPTQLAYLTQIEQGYIKRILDILVPVVGHSNVRAQVTADLDFSQSESTAEIYKPNATQAESAIRSQQNSESSDGNSANAKGVPGALSNQPPGVATAPIDGSAKGQSAAAGASTSSQRSSTVNYEVDKTTKHVRAQVGNIKRLSAAVVVNYRSELDKSGKAKATPFSEKELEQLRALTKEAMGFSESRGDSLNVVNTPFSVELVNPIPEPVWWKNPDNISLAKEIGKNVLVGLVGLYVLFGVIRPFFRQLATVTRVEPAALPETIGASANGAEAAVVRIDSLQTARELARQDPKLVAGIVKTWVGQ
jgi:flagellar M-ring protein FliF